MSTPIELIRPKELSILLGVSLCTLWRWRQQGKLPHPIQLGPRLTGWRREVIEDWLTNQNQG